MGLTRVTTPCQLNFVPTHFLFFRSRSEADVEEEKMETGEETAESPTKKQKN